LWVDSKSGCILGWRELIDIGGDEFHEYACDNSFEYSKNEKRGSVCDLRGSTEDENEDIHDG